MVILRTWIGPCGCELIIKEHGSFMIPCTDSYYIEECLKCGAAWDYAERVEWDRCQDKP